MTTLDSTLVFISDLHLGPSFHEETQVLPLDWSSWAALYRKNLDKFFSDNCIGHNKAIVRALPKYLRRLLVDLQKRGVYGRDSFDQCVALGDLVTWPSPDAFQFFTSYATSDRWRDPHSSSLLPGLDFKSNDKERQITVIPGNHDKLLRCNLNLFNTGVIKPLHLESISPQGASVIRRTIGTREFVFLAVDASTYTTERDLRVTRSARYHLAGGSISKALLEQVDGLAAQIAKEQAIRVLLIHYPINFGIASNLNGKAHNLFLKHDVDGIEKLLDTIPRGSIDFAAHGHLHIPGFYSYGGFPVLSLGTTLQRDSSSNDFYLVTVSDSGQIRAEHHVWHESKTGFRHDPSLSGRLN
jgi:hypothetical protein